MPQLAPVNWIYVFSLSWVCVIVVVVLLWWSFAPVYGIGSEEEGAGSAADVNIESGVWSWE